MIGEMNKYKKVTLDKLKYKHKKINSSKKQKNIKCRKFLCEFKYTKN